MSEETKKEEAKKPYQIPNTLRALQRAASDDYARENIQGVVFREEFAAATNGYIFAARLYSTEEKSKNLPIGKQIRFGTLLEHIKDGAYCPECDEWIDTCDLRSVPALESSIDYWETDGALLANVGGVARVLTKEFPDPQEIFKKPANPVRIAINAELLLQLAKALGATNGGIVLEFDKENDSVPIMVIPVAFSYSTLPPDNVIGVIMPIRLDKLSEDEIDKRRVRILNCLQPAMEEPKASEATNE